MDIKERELTRIRYPHMMKEEVEIWRDFLKKYGERFAAYRYDVHVGEGVGKLPQYDEKTQDMAIRLTQKRIDVVAYKGSDRFIIEIKDRAGMSAVGQLVVEKRLYEKKYGIDKVSGLAIVARSIDPDVRKVAEEMHIRIVLV